MAAIRARETDVPDKWRVGADGWGLGRTRYGWGLGGTRYDWGIGRTRYGWDGVAGYGHDGAATGRYAFLRVVPTEGVAVGPPTNGGSSRLLHADPLRELMAEPARITMPAPFAPAAEPPAVDITPWTGTYKREGAVITVGERNGTPHLVYAFADGAVGRSPDLETELVPLSDTVVAGSGGGASCAEDRMPVVFATLSEAPGAPTLA